MVDRFQFSDKPPKIIGQCASCQDDIQEYDEYICGCGSMVCEECVNECWICGSKSCDTCMSDKDCNGEYICEICLSNRKYLVDSAIAGFNVENYYYSAQWDTDDEIVLEFSSVEYPTILIQIDKVKQ